MAVEYVPKEQARMEFMALTAPPETLRTEKQFQNFWSKVRFPEDTINQCWNWTRCTHKGYGQVGINHRLCQAHRVAYIFLFGAIPEELEIDHLCRNRLCVNPMHLEPVPSRVNTLRGDCPAAINARKTHCIRGHEFTPENTLLWRNKKRCRFCTRVYMRKYYQTHPEKWGLT